MRFFVHFVWVFLETSTHFSGIGNDFGLDAQRLTLESTWWSHVKSSEINQKSFGFFTGIQKWVLKMWWWWRSFWFSWEILMTFSSTWVIPCQGGFFQFLISSRKCYCSIWDWAYVFFTTFRRYHLFRMSLFSMVSHASISLSSSRTTISMSPFQIHPVHKTKSRNILGSTFFPNWWIRDWSFVEIGWYSFKEPNWRIGPWNGSLTLVFFGLLTSTSDWPSRRTPGRTPFHPRALFCFLPCASFVGPSASRRHLFSDHDNGRLRSGTVSVTLTLAWLFLESFPSLGVTTGRWPSR